MMMIAKTEVHANYKRINILMFAAAKENGVGISVP